MPQFARFECIDDTLTIIDDTDILNSEIEDDSNSDLDSDDKFEIIKSEESVTENNILDTDESQETAENIADTIKSIYMVPSQGSKIKGVLRNAEVFKSSKHNALRDDLTSTFRRICMR